MDKVMEFSKNVYAVVDTQEYVAVEKDGTVYVATQENSGLGSYDCCGYTVQGWRGEWEYNCSFSDADLREVTSRIDDALYWADNPAKAIAKIADRTDVSVAIVKDYGGYGYEATPLTEHSYICREDRLVVSPYGAMDYAKNFIATVSSKTWTIGKLPAEEFEPDTFDLYGDCEDICHGYVWQNVDNFGDSFPTEQELIDSF